MCSPEGIRLSRVYHHRIRRKAAFIPNSGFLIPDLQSACYQ